TFTLSNSSITRPGSAAMGLVSIEAASLTGSGGADTFDVTGWTGAASVVGNGGTDTITSGAADGTSSTTAQAFTLTNGTLTRVAGATTTVTSLTGISQASLTGGARGDTFDVTGFTGPATLVGNAGNDVFNIGTAAYSLVGGAGNDTVQALKLSSSYVLTDTSLSGAGIGT